jgi:hypothetical protein
MSEVAGHVQPPGQRQRNITREVRSLRKRGANIRIDGQEPVQGVDHRMSEPLILGL